MVHFLCQIAASRIRWRNWLSIWTFWTNVHFIVLFNLLCFAIILHDWKIKQTLMKNYLEDILCWIAGNRRKIGEPAGSVFFACDGKPALLLEGTCKPNACFSPVLVSAKKKCTGGHVNDPPHKFAGPWFYPKVLVRLISVRYLGP